MGSAQWETRRVYAVEKAARASGSARVAASSESKTPAKTT